MGELQIVNINCIIMIWFIFVIVYNDAVSYLLYDRTHIEIYLF